MCFILKILYNYLIMFILVMFLFKFCVLGNFFEIGIFIVKIIKLLKLIQKEKFRIIFYINKILLLLF